MLHTFSLVGGASLGAGLIFILDPDRGRWPALVRDKAMRSSTKRHAGPVGKKRSSGLAFMQPHWTPSARLAAALMGSAALLYGLNQRRVGATTLAAGGLSGLGRSATNQESLRQFDKEEHNQRAA